MKNDAPEQLLAWLESGPPLQELRTAYPEVWDGVQREIAGIVNGGSVTGLQTYLKNSALQGGVLARKLQKSRADSKVFQALLYQMVRHRMAQLAIKQHCVSEATGIENGKVRFNLLNGIIAQKLLFSDGLVRKPVSLFWFRLVWPLLWQRRLLMPLVQPEGIYCFYSNKLIRELAGLIGGRSCLEIAAGDGTLSEFLQNAGIAVTATDDYSWKHQVKYSEKVIRCEAREALLQYAPQVVICSWPPAGNAFERQVFRTRSVQLYIVIGSRHDFAAGNWDDYRQQNAFDLVEETRLSSLVLPPELDPAVYVFRRKPE